MFNVISSTLVGGVLPFCRDTVCVFSRLGQQGLFVSLNSWKFSVSHFLGQILVCAGTICQYCQTSVSCTISVDHLSHPFISAPVFPLCQFSVFDYYYLLLEFFTSVLADDFHWSLSDSKSPQVSRTLLSILAVPGFVFKSLTTLPTTIIVTLSTPPMRIYPTPPPRTGFDTKPVFKLSITDLNSEFSFSTSYITKAKEHNLRYYWPIAGRRTNGFMPFSKTSTQRNTRIASSKIWTRITDSISKDDNRYI